MLQYNCSTQKYIETLGYIMPVAANLKSYKQSSSPLRASEDHEVRNTKKCCHINAVFCILRTTEHYWKFDTSIVNDNITKNRSLIPQDLNIMWGPWKFDTSIVNDNITKNRSLIPQDLNIMWGPYKFNLAVTVDHHEYFMNCGHYTNEFCQLLRKKTSHCSYKRTTESDISDAHNSSTVCILLYKLILGCLWPDHGG